MSPTPPLPPSATHSDAVEDYQEEARALVEALLDANALELLVQRLGSLDEKVCAEVGVGG
jgi:hypothetical protein